MQTLLAILLGKSISLATRRLHLGGGSAAPGLYSLKIDPNLVEKLIKRIPRNVVITGTNGKTTTARLLAHFATQAGLKVIRNHTGSNLERGIASSLINSYSHIQSGKVDLGVWELDEAAFNSVAPKIKPETIVFLNVFRDQLDRYGEVDSVVKRWCETLKRINPKTLILVNGDDENTAKLGTGFSGRTLKFGVKDYKIIGEAIKHSKEEENLDFEAKDIKLNGLAGSKFDITIYDIQYTINLPLPGIYHIYDFLAAFSAGLKLGLDPKQMVISLKTFSPAFGRMEKLPLPRLARSAKRASGKAGFGYIFLIKNPAGATQVFETIAPQLKQNDRLLLALNDNLADGTDVSWIWDGQFERLLSPSLRAIVPQSGGAKRRGNLIVSGTRAEDLTLRLKYAGFKIDVSDVEENIEKALKKAQKDLKGRLFILPTYTAMLELQKILTKSGIKKNYWEEEG